MKKRIVFWRVGEDRFYINGIIFEFAKRKAFGFMVDLDTNEQEIVFSIGWLFGLLYISIPFRFGRLSKFIDGKNFAEWGREIGFMVTNSYAEYSLYWYSDCNRPSSWRSGYFFFD